MPPIRYLKQTKTGDSTHSRRLKICSWWVSSSREASRSNGGARAFPKAQQLPVLPEAKMVAPMTICTNGFISTDPPFLAEELTAYPGHVRGRAHGISVWIGGHRRGLGAALGQVDNTPTQSQGDGTADVVAVGLPRHVLRHRAPEYRDQAARSHQADRQDRALHTTCLHRAYSRELGGLRDHAVESGLAR